MLSVAMWPGDGDVARNGAVVWRSASSVRRAGAGISGASARRDAAEAGVDTERRVLRRRQCDTDRRGASHVPRPWRYCPAAIQTRAQFGRQQPRVPPSWIRLPGSCYQVRDATTDTLLFLLLLFFFILFFFYFLKLLLLLLLALLLLLL